MADQFCADCGSEIPNGSVRGLCSRCLLAMALELGPDQAPPGWPDEPVESDDLSGIIPGETIRYFGDYELLEEIGRGGMGVVFKARQVSLNRVVALKMIVAGELASPAVIQRFHTEAEAAAGLDHPNIVPIYEIGEDQGRHYFTMKFVEGGTLGERMAEFLLPGNERGKADGPGSKWKISDQKSKIARLMIKVARAVHYAHQRGIIHRDLKPGNILLDREGEPFVADFGLAKMLEENSDLTQTAGILGTPGYMSPEQASGKRGPLTTASDIFSLGSLLYQLTTGRPPFRGANAMETLRQVIENEPRRPRVLNSTLDRDLETICLKCLEKNPERRYDSASALADDLEASSAGKPIQARPITSWGKTIKWARRKPAMAALGAMSALAVLALSGIAISFPAYQEAEKARIEAETQRHKTEEALAGTEAAQRRTEDALAQTEAARQETEAALALAESAKGETEAALAKANAAYYARNIAWAEREWLANNILGAEQMLEHTDPELRGWEWDYLKNLLNADLFTATGHAAGVRRLALTADGNRLASISEDGILKMWNSMTGVEEPPLELGLKDITAMAFSPDGIHAAFGTESSRVVVWDMVAEREVWVEKHTFKPLNSFAEFRVTSLDFSPDGKTLASGSRDKSIKLWSVESGELLRDLRGHREEINSLRFHPQGRYLASASGELQIFQGRVTKPEAPGEIRVWDIDSGDSILTFGKGSRVIYSIAYSPDGTQLVSGHGDRIIRIWDSGTGALRMTIPGDGGEVLSVNYNLIGDRIVSGNADSAARVWDSATGKQIGIYRGHRREVYDAVFDKSGSIIFSAGGEGTIKSWDSAKDQRFHIAMQPHERGLSRIKFSPDGKHFAISSGVYEIASRRLVFSFKTAHGGVFNSADGKYIASGRSVFDSSGREVQTLNHSQWSSRDHASALTSDGKFLAFSATSRRPRGEAALAALAARRFARSTQAETEIVLWNLETGLEAKTLSTGTNEVWEVAFSPDDSLLAAAIGNLRGPGGVMLWNWKTGELVQTFTAQQFAFWSVAFSPDGKYLAAGGGYYRPSPDVPRPGEVSIWEVETGREILSRSDLPNCVFSVAFSPGSKRLISASGQHGGKIPVVLKLWDVVSGTELLNLHGAKSTVYGVAFHPDGKTIAGIDSEGNVLFWSTEPHKADRTAMLVDQ